MDFQAAVNWLLGLPNYESAPVAYSAQNYDLRRVEELLRPLGDPHLGIKAVHIAGTKGKGSTAAMTASVLGAAGYRTGLYTSPHLHSIRERIRIGNELISEGNFAGIVGRIRPEVERLNQAARYGQLTTYEALTALTFVYFARQRADYQVLEVGLGGRLDATNVIEPPQVCVITSLSMDHMAILGDTLAKVATEKAGIIKEGCTVVSAPQPAEAAAVIEEACRRRNAALIRVGRDITWQRQGGDHRGQEMEVRGRRGSYRVSIPLLGTHQLENAATAIAALEVLAEKGARLSDSDIVRGLKETSWPGRLQVLGERPWLVVDGAHNADSARRLVEAVRQCFPYRYPILVMGTSNDKDIPGMVSELARLGARVIIARSRHPRSAGLDILEAEWRRHGISPETAQSVAGTIERAKALASSEDLILVTGSLFVVAEALEYEGQLQAGGR